MTQVTLDVGRLARVTRRDLIAARRARMERRQLMIAASSILDNVTNAEFGVVPMPVHRRATIPWPL